VLLRCSAAGATWRRLMLRSAWRCRAATTVFFLSQRAGRPGNQGCHRNRDQQFGLHNHSPGCPFGEVALKSKIAELSLATTCSTKNASLTGVFRYA
jgi:hypothetical protein